MSPFQPPPFLRGIEKSMIRKISDRAKPGSISLGLGEPDLPTPEVIQREAVRVIQEEKSGYTLQAGLPQLRERIVSDYPHMNLNLDQIIVTAGSQESLYLILRTLVNDGDEVLIPVPTYPLYTAVLAKLNAKTVYYRTDPARDWQPDLILLDIMMPKISGFEVCKRLRHDPKTSDIAVLMITALDQPSDVERAVEAGTDDFLTKPINKSELLLRVRSALKSRLNKRELDRALAYIDAVERGEK